MNDTMPDDDADDDVARRHDTAPPPYPSEQVWVVPRGPAALLLAEGETAPVQAGDVVRTSAGELHGLNNSSAEPFVYLTAATPHLDLRPSYRMRATQEEIS